MAKFQPKTEETVVAPGVQVMGNLVCDNNLMFDGLIAGDIEAGGNVTIGPNAVVTGDVNCADLIVAGRIQGNIHAKGNLNLVSSAMIKGNLNTKKIVIEEGAAVSGHLQMEQAEKAFGESSD